MNSYKKNPLKKQLGFVKYLTLTGGRLALTPQPSPARRGGARFNYFLVPISCGRGVRGGLCPRLIAMDRK
jgi:hypothetical protein